MCWSRTVLTFMKEVCHRTDNRNAEIIHVRSVGSRVSDLHRKAVFGLQMLS